MYAPLGVKSRDKGGRLHDYTETGGVRVASACRRLVEPGRARRSYWRYKGAADRLDSKVQRARPHGSVEGDFSRAFLLNRVL